MKELRQDMNSRFEAVQTEIKNTQQEMNKRFEASEKENYRRFGAVMQIIHNLEETQERILVRLDVKEQVTDLETRFVSFEARFNRVGDFIQQWKSNLKEKKLKLISKQLNHNQQLHFKILANY
ncbi:MAG: hypothetical protein JSW07_13015 [bacterium]|nr:MAG: hypothetical protein JSW07_13015 [bacterium]